MSKNQAVELQQSIDWEFNVDLATFTNAELSRLKGQLEQFLSLNVSTAELEPVEDVYQDDDSVYDESEYDYDDEDLKEEEE